MQLLCEVQAEHADDEEVVYLWGVPLWCTIVVYRYKDEITPSSIPPVPYIVLFKPFLPRDRLSQALPMLQAALTSLEPFQVVLNQIKVDFGGKKHGHQLYLGSTGISST